MSRRRKPVQMSVEQATEALKWRAQILCEMLSALKQPPQFAEPIKRMTEALADYEASKRPQPFALMICESCKGSCTERHNGLCNRCFDLSQSQESFLSFTETAQ